MHKMVINQVVKDMGLSEKLEAAFDTRNSDLILDLAAYSIITENNAAQYYPDYAYNHPLFTPNMKAYSDSTISDFLRDLSENQRQIFLDLWNEERNRRERIYVSYDSTNKNCESGDISMVEYGAAKAAGERVRFEENIQQMQSYLDSNRNVKREFGPVFDKYFFLHRDQDSGVLVYAEPKLQVIQDEMELCGYFAIITSEKMDAKQAIRLYKSRDASEKLFRADKSFLGNGALRVASQEAADNKIFIGFIALIIRCRIYTALKDKASTMIKKPNYFTGK